MIFWPEENATMPVIEFAKETVGHILKDRTTLAVPKNQREYQWKEEHVLDLYTDLQGAYADRAEYFLGAIIVVVNKNAEGIQVYDGQQRLATTTILIGAIRDYIHKTDKDTATNIARESLYSPERKTNILRPHLTLSATDNDYFYRSVVLNPGTEERNAAKADIKKKSHRRIGDAAKCAAQFIADILKPVPESQRLPTLHGWLDFLVEKVRVIWVEVEDQPTAYKIFETMNDRGLKLSAADLIKNYAYSLAGKRESEVIAKWESMATILESLGEDGDLVDYLRYLWITTHGPTRSSKLFDQIKKEVNSEPTVVNWVANAESRANDYAALLTSSHQAWNQYHQEVRGTIATLRYLGVSQVRPLLLAAYGKFDPKPMSKLLKLAVNWSVRFLVSGTQSGTIEGHYSRNARAITAGDIKDLGALSAEMARVVPADDVFQAAFSTASVQTASLARYYLRRIQIQADGSAEPQYVPNEGQPITLEHVLPQNPGRGWEHIKPEEVEAFYNRLGNQALLAGSVNSALNNVDFESKRKALAESEFSLTSMVGKDYNKWDLDAIANRQIRLAEHAVAAWPLK